ncbi:MAG: polysaccharide biosynthesis protein [Gaiella sp.]
MIRGLLTRHSLWQIPVDALLAAAAWVIAWRLRFVDTHPVYYDRYFDAEIVALVVALKLPIFAAAGFYNRWWRYVSTRDMWSILRGVGFATLTVWLVLLVLDLRAARVPVGVWALDLLLCLALFAGTRLAARTILERPAAANVVARGREAIVVGAGDAGQRVVREMLRNPALGYTPIGIVDDDARKKNLRLHGVRVLGTTSDLPHLLREQRPDEVLIAIPSAPGGLRGRVVEMCRQQRVPVKTLPGISELVSLDSDLARQLRPVEVEDVLGRDPVQVDISAISSYLQGRTVLVTGAGGSIGSELCRQIARAAPASLVLVDQSESPLFEIDRELRQERGFAATVPTIADVVNRARVRQVMAETRPHVVFHAAAYKHVPLMEANPLESVRNNVIGTRIVADAAVDAGVERFVLVSTDKALNPYSVYGQSKTLCEWVVTSHSEDAGTGFVAVRFGNVLNSAGSVIPIFRRQIERGGPVTVTDPEMTRFFMTIPEAAALVIQAGAIGGHGRIFVLDMGEPIRILDLAHNMIRLSGREPDRDIAIEFIGTRPGEKMHEELFAPGETWEPTAHPKILGLAVDPIDRQWLESELDALERLVQECATADLAEALARIVASPRRAGDRAGAALE